MPASTIDRPTPSEYAPYFAAYIDQVPTGDVIGTLESQIDDTCALLGALSDREAHYRYAPGKWSIKEVVGHIADCERIMAYRALCFARGEAIMLPGFDEDAYVSRAKFGSRALGDLVAEMRAVRAATVPFFSSLDAEELARRGKANNREYTVRALAYIIAGHERHHVEILHERYLPGLRDG